MSKKSGEFTLTYGGWFQRTTLHLSEVHGFLSKGISWLPLSKIRLKALHSGLRLTSVERVADELEYVKATTKDGIEIRYYEDGLFILEKKTTDIQASKKIIKEYLEKRFSPAISYIFSLGSPIPKELANIKKKHPAVIGVITNNHSNLKISQKSYGQVYNKISSQNTTVYKTQEFIFIATTNSKKRQLRALVEEQIFFREFKDQLERYLDIHRTIWEKISAIKEKHEIKGSEIGKFRSELDSYQKSINLIKNRINQMDNYVKTRASLARTLRIDKDLITLFQYKFETLLDTLTYIKEIWSMTSNYVDSGIRVISELETQAGNSTLKTIQAIASVGFLAGIIGYLSEEAVPELTIIGSSYFIGLILAGAIIGIITKYYDRRKKYTIHFTERSKKI